MLTDRQTHSGKYITSLAEVIRGSGGTLHSRQSSPFICKIWDLASRIWSDDVDYCDF